VHISEAYSRRQVPDRIDLLSLSLSLEGEVRWEKEENQIKKGEIEPIESLLALLS
jgi:hypothetical protein